MKAPDYFSPEAKYYFDFIVKTLEELGQLEEIDQPIIEGLAFNLALIRNAQEMIMKEGIVVDALHGKKPHPAIEVLNRSQAKVNEAYKLLGLDSDTRMKIEQLKMDDLKNDPLIKILKGEYDN